MYVLRNCTFIEQAVPQSSMASLSSHKETSSRVALAGVALSPLSSSALLQAQLQPSPNIKLYRSSDLKPQANEERCRVPSPRASPSHPNHPDVMSTLPAAVLAALQQRAMSSPDLLVGRKLSMESGGNAGWATMTGNHDVSTVGRNDPYSTQFSSDTSTRSPSLLLVISSPALHSSILSSMKTNKITENYRRIIRSPYRLTAPNANFTSRPAPFGNSST